MTVHGGYEKQVDEPADEKEPQCKEPDRSRYRLAVIEPVRSGKTEEPQKIADGLAMGVIGWGHTGLSFLSDVNTASGVMP